MEKEKAEIANLVKKYGRVQSLMRFINKETLTESYCRQPKGKAVGWMKSQRKSTEKIWKKISKIC